MRQRPGKNSEQEPLPGAQPRYPENAPGPFYVEKDLCLICCTPESAAPDLIGFYKDPSGTHRESHCYFKKQPETPEELERAIEAMHLCCCGAYRYGGSDPAIIRRLIELNVGKDQIDLLFGGSE
jgi:hypothetical protein